MKLSLSESKVCLCVALLIYGFMFSPLEASPQGSSGVVFVRQKASDVKTFRDVFLSQKGNLKNHGFVAYSLHRDLNDKKTFILTLKCSDLEKGVEFIRTPEFMAAMEKSGARIPTIWCGLDVMERKYNLRPKMGGGIVIARNEVRDYDFWLKCFRAENHKHPGRKYRNEGYGVYHLSGKPEVAIVVHEASDISKATIFMSSDALNGEMEATGVVGLQVWYGINVEEGFF